jgi:hypothetical protein
MPGYDRGDGFELQSKEGSATSVKLAGRRGSELSNLYTAVHAIWCRGEVVGCTICRVGMSGRGADTAEPDRCIEL